VADAGRKYNLNQGNLASVARGERNHHKGYTCRYIKKEKKQC